MPCPFFRQIFASNACKSAGKGFAIRTGNGFLIRTTSDSQMAWEATKGGRCPP